MKIPCKSCLTYAICKGQKSIKILLDMCYVLNDYIISEERCRQALIALKPKWFHEKLNETGYNSKHYVNQAVRNIVAYSEERRKEK